MQDTTQAIRLTAGGIAEETEVMTARGPRRISTLDEGDSVFALDPTTGVSKLKSLREIRRFDYEGDAIHLQARRVDQLLHPDHRIPYRTKSFPTVRFQRTADIRDREKYWFVNSWESISQSPAESIDLTEILDEYQICAAYSPAREFRKALPEGCKPTNHTTASGFQFDPETFEAHKEAIESLADEISIREEQNHKRYPYRFDADDFVRLVGWFVAEGSVTWSKSSSTADIRIAQQAEDHRNRISRLFQRLGIEVGKNSNSFWFGSKLYGRLLEQLCGNSSATKRLPEFVWNLGLEQKQLLLEILIDGDGDDQNVYFTISDRLKDDVLRLCMELGIKPRYVFRDGVWEIYTNSVNDRLSSSKQASLEEYTGTMYRVTVEDYCTIMAGRNGKFQWTGVSAVS